MKQSGSHRKKISKNKKKCEPHVWHRIGFNWPNSRVSSVHTFPEFFQACRLYCRRCSLLWLVDKRSAGKFRFKEVRQKLVKIKGTSGPKISVFWVQISGRINHIVAFSHFVSGYTRRRRGGKFMHDIRVVTDSSRWLRVECSDWLYSFFVVVFFPALKRYLRRCFDFVC